MSSYTPDELVEILTPYFQTRGGGAWELIRRLSLLEADGTFDFDPIPYGYNHLEVRGVLRSDQADIEDYFSATFNNDGGNNYGYKWARFFDVANDGGQADNLDTDMRLGFIDAANSDADCFSAVRLSIPMYANENVYKTILSDSMNVENQGGADDMTRSVGMGNWRSTVPITSMQIFPGAGTDFKQYSELYLYGVT